jgi:polyhydroxyalkanoate synthesis regulator phasin
VRCGQALGYTTAVTSNDAGDRGVSHADRTTWIADRIAGARADAERIVSELVRSGRLSAAEASAVASAVDDAIERGRALVEEALREPRRILASLRTRAAAATDDPRDASPAADLAARLAALEARIAALESHGSGHQRPRGDGEGI